MQLGGFGCDRDLDLRCSCPWLWYSNPSHLCGASETVIAGGVGDDAGDLLHDGGLEKELKNERGGWTVKASDVDFAGPKGTGKAERGVAVTHEPGKVCVAKSPCAGVGLR